jgi:hypothetical protein
MTHDAEKPAIQPNTEPAARTAGCERMRRHRERLRQGLRCLTIELRETEIDALLRYGLLTVETRNDPVAICNALHRFLATFSSSASEEQSRPSTISPS